MLSVGGFSRLAILSKLGMLSVCIVVTVVYSLLVLDPSRDDLPQVVGWRVETGAGGGFTR